MLSIIPVLEALYLRVWCDGAMVGREKKYLDPDLRGKCGYCAYKEGEGCLE